MGVHFNVLPSTVGRLPLAVNETNSQMFLTGDRNVTNGQAANSRFVDLTTNRPAGWTANLHKLQGNVGLADGSVQPMTSSRLRAAMAATGDPTNRLAIRIREKDMAVMFLKARFDFVVVPVNAGTKLRHLSKGEYAKVGLALALAPNPEVLILDEPTSGLDLLVRREFLQKMRCP